MLAPMDKDVVISVRDLTVGFGDQIVLDRLDLDVMRGEILGFVGASGAGKSVLMRTIIGLLPKRGGHIEVFGTDLDRVGEEERRAIERRWGILFQHGALFSSLTVAQNIQFPIRENLSVSQRLLDESGSRWRGRWRSTRKFCSSMSRRRGLTLSAPEILTTLLRLFSVL
jgi:phospholipid/cholesterol/gamma-HCH transport system ATP-binding protein